MKRYRILTIHRHNHALLTPTQVWFLPADRIISLEDENCVLLLKEASLTVIQ